MKFNLYMHTDNAAFEDDNPGEIVRILRAVADRIEAAGEAPTHYLTIFDVNGNDVGRYALKGDDA